MAQDIEPSPVLSLSCLAHRDTRNFITNSELAELEVEETLAKMVYRGAKALLTK